MSESRESDTEIIAKLRRGLEQSDPVPADIAGFARAVWSWRDIDAELAEISFDSIDESAPAGVRSATTTRVLSFDTGDMTLDIEFNPASSVLMGQVSTDQPFSIELHVGGAHFTSEGDELGRFDFADLPSGPVSLVVRLEDGRVVKTSWVLL